MLFGRLTGIYAYSVVEVVAVPVPSIEELDLLALVLGPLVTIAERRVQAENNNASREEHNDTSTADDRVLLDAEASDTGGGEVPNLAERDDGEEESREVVVQEQLALHEEEGEVVECPTKHGNANLVVEALENGVTVVVAAALPSQDRESLEYKVQSDGSSR
jgi:hypothetical protein